MFKNNILLILSLCFISQLSFAQGQCQNISMTSSAEQVAAFQGTGSVTIKGDLCVTFNPATYAAQTSGNLAIYFNQFSYDKAYGFSMTGGFNILYSSNTQPLEVKLTYDGGPINYMINGQSYEVYYQNLQLNMDASMQYISATGGATVNGVYMPAENIPYEFLRII